MKQIYRLILPFLFLYCYIPFISSQIITLNPGYVSGKLIDDESSKAIPFVHILNESLNISGISDTAGRFIIRAQPGDTLVFSVIGYLGKYIVLDKPAYETQLVIALNSRTYEIAEVAVFGFTSYSHFKEQLKKLKIPETETDRLRENLRQISLEIGKEAKYQLAMEKAAAGGNLMSMPILSPEEKQRLKLKDMMLEDGIQREIDNKFNRQIVGNLTGLKNLELDEFMLFCKLDRKFLQFGSQYDILLKVLVKLEEFRELKKKGTIQSKGNYDCYT